MVGYTSAYRRPKSTQQPAEPIPLIYYSVSLKRRRGSAQVEAVSGSHVSIRDGLIAAYKDRKVRVRISGDMATVAIKGPRVGAARR
jgi:hypothetical protein